MEHIDWLDPDNIIINNGDKNKSFLDDMKSGEFNNLRLLFINQNNFIRYEIKGNVRWYLSIIIEKRLDVYYLNILDILDMHIPADSKLYGLENKYKQFNRNELLAEILK